MSEVKVNKISPRSGTAFTLGDSGDTFTVPSGAGLTLTDSTLLLPTTINTDKLDPKSGTDLELGSSGDTITIPSGATITNSGTASGFGGGKVLQVVTATTSSTVTQTASSYATSGLTADITPASTSNKVLVITSCAIQTYGDTSNSSGRSAPVGLFRGTVSGTKIQEHIAGVNMVSATTSDNNWSYNTVSFVVLDSPSTTSSQAYTVGISGSGATDIKANNDSNTSTMTLLEIAG